MTEDGLQLDVLAQSESVFALSNGHIGLRGNLEEGEPFGLPGTYLNAFYETRPLPYAEAGYGYPEDGQTVVNVTNGKIIRLLVDDEPFDIRYGELLDHGARWTCAQARSRDRALALAERPRGPGPHRAAGLLRAALGGGDPLRSAAGGRPRSGRRRSPSWSPTSRAPPRATPRAAAAMRAPLEAEEQEVHEHRIVLVHWTASGLRMAAGWTT